LCDPRRPASSNGQADAEQKKTRSSAHHENFDALYLPGGHDKGVREYLESNLIQYLVVDFFVSEKPVAAICHGVIVAARSADPNTGK